MDDSSARMRIREDAKSNRWSGGAWSALVLTGACLLVACQTRPVPLAPADASYSVQGTVQRSVGKQGSFREVVIRHQSIPDFRNREGDIAPMDSMAMPFAVAEGVGLDQVSKGVAVDFTFEVRWNTDPVLLIVDLTPLPEGTVVDFSPNRAADADEVEVVSEPRVEDGETGPI